jgi:hypothetical protein
MNFNELIKPELLILIPVLYGLGMFLKASTVNDKFIPLILLAISITLSVCYVSFVMLEGFNASTIIVAIIQGILIASTVVFGNQLIKQSSK